MNWDAIGAIGEIIGAIAVVVSLIYLASQLRESNELSRENAYREVQRGLDDVMSELGRDEGLHKAWREALYEGKSVSDADRERIGFLLNRGFGSINVAYHASRKSSDVRKFCMERLDVYLSNAVIREWWQRQRMMQPEPFRSLVDQRARSLDKAGGTGPEKSA